MLEQLGDEPGVGMNLHDHMYAICRFSIEKPLTISALSDAEFAAAQELYLKDATGPLATNFDEAGAFLRTDPASEWPDVQWHFEPTYSVPFFDGAPPERDGYSIFANVCRPESRGALTLFSAVARFGHPTRPMGLSTMWECGACFLPADEHESAFRPLRIVCGRSHR